MRNPRGNPWVTLVVLSVGFFMTLLDLTIVNVAIPTMLTRLHASLDEIVWVVNSYILVVAALLITAGRIGDMRGPRNLFAAGVALFTLASAACGLAATPGQLIAFRVVQGIGAAMLMPQTLTVLTRTFPAGRLGAALGVWSLVSGASAVAGPTLGGLLVTAFGWRWIFFINVPIGAAVLVATVMSVPDVRPGGRHRLDLGGVLLASLALLAICYGLVEGQRYHWGQIASVVSIPSLIGAGAVLMAAFLYVQSRRQAREPLVPFALFHDRNYSVTAFVSGVIGVSMLGFLLPATIYLQSVVGMTAVRAGLTLAPAAVAQMCLAPLAGRWSDRAGGITILIAGLVLFAGGLAWMFMTAQPGSSSAHFLLPLIVAGAGMGCAFAPTATIAMRSVPPQVAGSASGVFNTSRQVGAVIGTAAVGALLQNRLAAALAGEAVRRSAAVPGPLRPAFVAAFQRAARDGMGVGTGQAAGAVTPPPGTPAPLAHALTQAGHQVFAYGFIDAMRTAMILPVGLMGIAVLACLALRAVRAGATAGTLTGLEAKRNEPAA